MLRVTLHELKFVRQYEGEMLRRWFDDDEGLFDLIAWVDDSGAVSGFQLSSSSTLVLLLIKTL